MRKLLGLALPLTLLLTLFLPVTVHASTSDFSIPSFTADYYLSRNDAKTSILKVKEVIVAEFPNIDQNHGILRAIPKTYQNHTVSLHIESVTNETGTAYPYTTSSENDNTVLKIGSADSYAHGLTTYVINYDLKNVINFQKTDELYWDVNGTEWPQTMGNVTARLHVPEDLTAQLSDQAPVCYSGFQNSSDQNCSITSNPESNETVITSSAINLSGGQNLTFVTGFKKGTFVLGPEIAAAKRRALLIFLSVLAAILFLPILTFIICFRKWWRDGRDPKGRGVIIPEYIAPKNLNVISSSYILNMNFGSTASSAGIIELAVAKYLRINEIQKKKFIGKSTDYEIEVVREVVQLPQEQQLILDALFDGKITVGSKAVVSEQKNKLYTTVKKVNDQLSTSLTAQGYFKTNPSTARKRFVLGATIMLIIGFVTFILLPIGVGLILSAGIAYFFSSIMPARSPQGVEMRSYLLGLKDYIKMAEADRLKYLQSPQGAEKTPIDPNNSKQQIKLFEDLLPYAILFGLEKEWAKQFKDLYTQPPDWYSGNMNGFNAVYLASSLHSFSSANSASFSAPSSSGSSGFGGGGFSGGGGGGGGGGGW